MSSTIFIIGIFALLCLCLAFVIGFLVGFAVKSAHQSKISAHQKRSKPRISQNLGESAVSKTIVSHFPPPHYHLLNNITIPFQDGTTQIDHILVSTKGIFVIETKNYSGWIFGDAKSKQWMQVIYKVKNRFQNPIHQNFLHVKVIQELLDFLPKEQIHSVVVFTGSAEFKSSMPYGVLYLHQLVDFLKRFQNETISANRVEFCVGRLECRRYEITKKTDIQHQAYLAQRFGKSE